MSGKASNIAKFNFKPQHKLFFDTNIWLYLFPPVYVKPTYLGGVYSRAFGRILEADTSIYIDTLIVCEFINFSAGDLFRIVKDDYKNFKKFRQSNKFPPIAKEIAGTTKNILDCCNFIDSGVKMPAIESMVDEYAEGESDFNDHVIADICKREGFILVTDDGDFKNEDIPILTANGKILKGE